MWARHLNRTARQEDAWVDAFLSLLADSPRAARNSWHPGSLHSCTLIDTWIGRREKSCSFSPVWSWTSTWWSCKGWNRRQFCLTFLASFIEDVNSGCNQFRTGFESLQSKICCSSNTQLESQPYWCLAETFFSVWLLRGDFLVYVRSFLDMRETEAHAVMLNGFELCGICTCPASTLAGFVKRLRALEQRHLCQPDVTEQKIEPCLVSTLPFPWLLEEISISALMNWGCKSLNTQNP